MRLLTNVCQLKTSLCLNYIKNTRVYYSACRPFTKHGKRIPILKKKKTVALKHVRKYELDKTCFVRDAAYANSKNLAKKNVAD